jgi:hypothetical protein
VRSPNSFIQLFTQSDHGLLSFAKTAGFPPGLSGRGLTRLQANTLLPLNAVIVHDARPVQQEKLRGHRWDNSVTP